jgi:hypothetical protein
MLKVGDYVSIKQGKNLKGDKVGVFRKVTEYIGKYDLYKIEGTEGYPYFEDELDVYTRVKNTRLARKMYPKAVEENGWLYI